MYEFYKKALIALGCLVALSVVIGYACVQRSHLQLSLLPARASDLPWRALPTSDRDQGGATTVNIVDAGAQLRYRFTIEKAVAHPYASAALVFEDGHGKPALVDLSRYSAIAFNARCAPANTLALSVTTFDPKVTMAGNLASYRTPTAFFSCGATGARIELDLTRLETPQWWFDMFKLDLSRQAYRLDRVARITFGSTFQSPMGVASSVEFGDIALHGRDQRYLYALAGWLLLAAAGYGAWFFRQHTRVLVADVKQKLQGDLLLVAYQQLSVEPHKDREKAAVLRFIASSYHQPELDLESVAAHTGANRNKINDILKAELGLTFSAYLNKLRLTEAARLLKENTAASVAEIAYSVGYGNVSYFNKLFKESYQCTPKVFRTLSTGE